MKKNNNLLFILLFIYTRRTNDGCSPGLKVNIIMGNKTPGDSTITDLTFLAFLKFVKKKEVSGKFSCHFFKKIKENFLFFSFFFSLFSYLCLKKRI